MEVKKKLVLWCGNAPNQKALANKIHMQFGLAGIVIDKKKKSLKKTTTGNLVQRIVNRIRFNKIDVAWKTLQRNYDYAYSDWPVVPLLEVDSINDENVKLFVTDISPDLIIVSGTGLVKEQLLSIPVEIGIINLHTGLSPYVKGGPNCTNWCIANNEWHLVGNTIMWINPGIDSGNIIVNETVDIRECKDLTGVQLKVMDHAHDLYLRAVKYLIKTEPPYVSIPQSELGTGRLFLTKQWTSEMRSKLLKNWKNRKNISQATPPLTIPLNN
ncbi:MAG: hypothetical protein H0V30_04405 [Chitinophagaceae bacterium]|jgi:folate-dependent phosphoribosylglycinamide formyltransferase PurN|nr:hypothetical protein [Chitinophagaceae bacterium]